MAAKVQRAAAAGYWQESLQPLASLAFVAPLLVAYEAGVVYLGPHAIRNGADVWLRRWLDLSGFGQYFLLPVLVCGLLLGWHHASRRPWKIDWRVVRVMWLEAAVLGLVLLLAAQLQGRLFGSWNAAAVDAALTTSAVPQTAARVVGYLGAGIYEEFFFRLLLLSALALGLQATGLNRRGSLIAAVAATSLLFAAAHYRFDLELFGHHFAIAHGDAFAWPSFLFRFAAGAVFGVLFAFRGFGIAVGTHAFYDLMIVLL